MNYELTRVREYEKNGNYSFSEEKYEFTNKKEALQMAKILVKQVKAENVIKNNIDMKSAIVRVDSVYSNEKRVASGYKGDTYFLFIL